MITEETRAALFSAQDRKYRDFQVKLIPTVNPEMVIGVRTPEIRKIAKQMIKRTDLDYFLKDLPHRYFDENQVHALTISEMKDYHRCVEEVNRFLPFVDNWATCDQMSPKVFRKHKAELLTIIREWIRSGHTYTIRFGIRMLMQHFLDEDFDPAYPDLVARIRSEEYYVNMMIAWYYATALAKQYDSILPFIEQKKLSKWIHNKTIQKAIESFRITQDQKSWLRTLKIPSNGSDIK